MNISCRLLMTGLLLLPVAGMAAAEPLSLERAEAEALARHPALAGQRARAEASSARPDQAGSLPDPRLSLNMMNVPLDSLDLGQEPMTQIQLGISQALPYPGKLDRKRRSAEHRARAAGQDVEALRLDLLRQVRDGWWRLAFLDRALLILDQNRVLLRQFLSVALTQYKVGKGLQQDVLLAQLELSRLQEQELDLRGQRRKAEAALNRLLDRPEQQSIELPGNIDESLPEVADEAELVASIGDHPRLRRRQEEMEAARQRLELARLELLPDFTLGASYGLRQGSNPGGSERSDFGSIMLSMNLPLYADSKQRRAIDQRQSEMDAARHALRDARAELEKEVGQAYSDYLSAREQVVLYRRGIIPQSRQTVASMLAGYRASKVDFLNLVRAQLTLYQYETQYWRSLSEARQALAWLNAAVGRDIAQGEEP